jgi:SAM-dependent methyltransferase
MVERGLLRPRSRRPAAHRSGYGAFTIRVNQRAAAGHTCGSRRGSTVNERPWQEVPGVTRRHSARRETAAANRRWWDRTSDDYQAEHGDFLRDDGFVWSPEGLDEADARLLVEVRGRRVLEVGCGAGQCGRWLRRRGAEAVGVDLSYRQLQHSRRLDRETGTEVPVVQGDALRLPFAHSTFDAACSAYGAVQFVADSAALMREVARVLRPGGRWVFSVTHPIRWCFPDDPGPDGLLARDPYFDRRPYVEQDERGQATYVEHHRTIGDRVREIVAAGFRLVDLVEPEWPGDLHRSWGQWSPLRGRILPGTAIFVTERE